MIHEIKKFVFSKQSVWLHPKDLGRNCVEVNFFKIFFVSDITDETGWKSWFQNTLNGKCVKEIEITKPLLHQNIKIIKHIRSREKCFSLGSAVVTTEAQFTNQHNFN